MTAAPFRIRALWRAALRDLWRHRTATLVALAGAIVAALVLRQAFSGALAAFDRLVADRPAELVYAGERAIAILATGLGSAALIGAITRAAALCRYGGGRARDGLVRAPSLLAINAGELLIQATLAIAALLFYARHLHHYGTAAGRAAYTTLLMAPLLVPLLLLFAAARVGQGLVARGLPLGLALVHGCDFTLRHFPSLTRLGMSALFLTSPLLLLAVLAPLPLRAALLAFAGLWSYAALIRLVGADARLASG